MSDYIIGKSIVITGSGGGFGKLVAAAAAARGAAVTCGDIDGEAAKAVAREIEAAGGTAQGLASDVTQLGDLRALTVAATRAFGRVDVMINNAGIMPLAYISDHERACEAWSRCIDINFKGVLNGIVAVYDQMLVQGQGHIINVSSIYGNHPVVGAAVYGATKAAVNYLSESLRVEARGKIKVTLIKPTGVPSTGLGSSVINREAVIGILGQNAAEFITMVAEAQAGTLGPEHLDSGNIAYSILDPQHVADAIILAINQPWGVSLGEVTVRASGDQYIL